MSARLPGARGGAAGIDRERARAALRSPAAAAVAALTALAAVLRFTRIGHQGFWFDEANTALLVHFSPGKMLGLIPQTESTPPLYYCVAWIWARIFGYGEAALRSLSALAGVLLISRRLRRRREARLAPRGRDRRSARGLQSAADLVLAGGAFLFAAVLLSALSLLRFRLRA